MNSDTLNRGFKENTLYPNFYESSSRFLVYTACVAGAGKGKGKRRNESARERNCERSGQSPRGFHNDFSINFIRIIYGRRS